VLHERVAKASGFFTSRLEEIFSLSGKIFVVDTDNQELKKKIQETLGKIIERWQMKKECLLACRQGFEISKYLRAKACATLQAEMRKTVDFDAVEKPEDAAEKNQELYERLKTLRNMLALNADLPVYRILTLGVIRQIAEKLPLTMVALRKIKGIGKIKAETYGEEILKLVKEYCDGKNIEGWTCKPSGKKERIPTHHITLNLWKEGKSIAKIAEERGMTVSTIESHLARNISEGKLDIAGLMPEEKIKRIAECFMRNGTFQLKPVKEEFGDQVSWGELRMVASHLAGKHRKEADDTHSQKMG
jgi:predicted transcriptional regulator